MDHLSVSTRIALLGTALILPGWLAGCGADRPPSGTDLRRRFPEHAAEVLDTGAGFTVSGDGFAPASSGTSVVALLPARAEGALRFQLSGGGEVRVRELGAAGEGVIEGRSVAYPRARGTSFWTAAGSGYEEWLSLDRTAGGERSVIAWEIEGARAEQREDGVELVDDAGVPRLRVTAPRAYAAGHLVSARLEARGARIELHVDAGGEEALVDPMWTSVSTMVVARTTHTATLVPSGDVIVIDGFDGNVNGASRVSERYVPSTNTWTDLQDSGIGRDHHAAVLLGTGRVLVTGGDCGCSPSHSLTSAQLYDPVGDTWSNAASMHVAREGHSATLLPDGRVLVLGGGSDVNLVMVTASGEIYDPTSDTWTFTQPMSAPRYGHSALLLSSGKILVVGGDTGDTAQVYDPTSDTWSAAASPPHTHGGYMHVVPSGKVVAVDGTNGETDIYDPGTDTWMQGALASTSRVTPATALLPSGKILIAGGYGGPVLASAEVYDPVGNVWSSIAPMSTARKDFTLTVLQNGDVLAAGGRGATNNLLGTSELLVPSAPAGPGAPCLSASECQSGFCVDNVCCSTACTGGECAACSVAAGAPADGTCALFTNRPCNDGDRCTQTDTCQNGICVGGNAVVCTALDTCHVPGTCNSATGVCDNPKKSDGASCDDGNACTQTDTCTSGVCKGTNPVVCTALDSCHVAGVCLPATGMCNNPTKIDGASCDDGDKCTAGDTCQSGTCTSGPPVTCAPQDACHTAGTCDPQTGTCSSPPVADGAPCDDGDKCTKTDTCQGGTCTGQSPVVCAALDECHVVGSCNPQTGACSNPAESDGSPCAGGTCVGGVCKQESATSSSGSSVVASSSAATSSSGGEGGSAATGSGGAGGMPNQSSGCSAGGNGAPERGAPWVLIGLTMAAMRRRALTPRARGRARPRR